MQSYQEPDDVGPAVGGHLRITNSERAAALNLLWVAHSDGRLSAFEYEQRVNSAQQAIIQDDLTPLLRDLTPVTDLASGNGLASQASTDSVSMPQSKNQASVLAVAVLGESHRTGKWAVTPRMTGISVLGEVTLDFTQVEWPGREIRFSCFSVLGEIKVLVPSDVEVITQVITIFGSAKVKGGQGPANGRRLHLSGIAVLGEVKIQRV